MENGRRTRAKRGLASGGKGTLVASVAFVCCIAILTPQSVARPEAGNVSVPSPPASVRAQANGSPSVQAFAPPLPEYMKTIGIPDAWAMQTADVTATIAIVDTGVDLRNSELKPYLLTGKNLVDNGKTVQDDNGHGTAVAGVILAIAKAGEAPSSQARWRGKLMPIKALDEFGAGNEEKLTRGIRYAVDQGADIIVLSLGLRRDAPGLRNAVAYAESRGVLLVAASGNDAAVFGEAAAVQYPAAYPTVLSVAGMNGRNPVESSTSGPENDVGAPWKVQTVTLGGGGIEMEGTSMGAPQAAAVAAMVKAAHPDWTPLRIREALRSSVLPDGRPNWNPNTGYGLLSAPGALRANAEADWREPNNMRANASPFPLGGEVAGTWSGAADTDWFVLETKYDGTVSISGDAGKYELYGEANRRIEPLPAEGNPDGVRIRWPAGKGRYWLLARPSPDSPGLPNGYRIVSGFAMNPDAREPNDTAASASTLPARDQRWTGTFHKRGDVDWFAVTLPKAGALKLSVVPDTTRIDPELRIQPAGGTEIVIDERGDGGAEYGTINRAKAGKYYFRIANVISTLPEAVNGTYAVSMEYITDKEDNYEPNDAPLTATPMEYGRVYNGLIQSAEDRDWFRFEVDESSKIRLTVGQIPPSMRLSVELRNKKLQTLEKWNNSDGRRTLIGDRSLPPGTYYVRIAGDKADRNQYYGLRLRIMKE